MNEYIKDLAYTERPVMERHLLALRDSLKQYMDLKFKNMEKRADPRLEQTNSLLNALHKNLIEHINMKFETQEKRLEQRIKNIVSQRDE